MPLDISTAIKIPGLPANMPLWDEETSEDFDHKSQSATRVMRCLWPNRVFITQLLRGQTTAGLIYDPPLAYPDAPWLFVSRVKTKGYEGADPATGQPTGRTVGVNGMVAYKYAALVVTYSTLDYLADQQLGSLSLDFGVKYVLPPSTGGAVFKYAVTQNDCLEPPPIPVTMVEFTRTINQVPVLPVQTVMNAAKNPINSLAFEGADPGLARFAGCKSSRQLDTYGNECWNVTMRFSIQSIPWDAQINPSPGANSSGSGDYVEPYEQLVYKSNGQPIIGRSDLNLLLSASAT